MSEEMVIFTRTFDLLHWLLPKASVSPKSTAARSRSG